MKQSTFCVIILLFHNLSFSQGDWEYPVKLNSEEWKSMPQEEIIAMQQIPDGILKEMKTSEVFKAWLDLPGRLEVLAYNNLQKGFDKTVKRFNVLYELLNRKDVGPVVLKEYLKLQPQSIKHAVSNIEKGKYITDFGFIEFILSQPEVLLTLTENEKKQLAKGALNNFQSKKNLKNKERDIFWEETNLILSGRILYNVKQSLFIQAMEQDDKIKEILNRGEIRSKDEYERIAEIILKSTDDMK